MNILEIMGKYLKENGFDGLVFEDSCGCGLDDLMPCDCPNQRCEPAYRHKPCGDPDCWCEGAGGYSTKRTSKMPEEKK